MCDYFHNLEPQKATELARNASNWISSADGRAAIEQSIRKTMELTNRLDQARRVEQKTLIEPVTI